MELNQIGDYRTSNGNGPAKPPSEPPCAEQKSDRLGDMPALKMLMMDECHPAAEGGGAGGEGGNPTRRSWRRRAVMVDDISADPRPLVMIH